MRLSDNIYHRMRDKYPEIADDEEFIKLKRIRRHGYTDTFSHSLRVAAVSELIAKKTGVDPDSAVKTALLHDFCLIDHNIKNVEKRQVYILLHPKEAVANSERFGLTDKERKAIRSHMFPIAPVPESGIAWVVTIADKAVAAYEGCYGFLSCAGRAFKHGADEAKSEHK